MRQITFLLACLARTGHGRRVAATESAAWTPVLGPRDISTSMSPVSSRGISKIQAVGSQEPIHLKNSLKEQRTSSPPVSMSSPAGGNNQETQKSYIDKLALILVNDRKQLVVRSRGKSVFFTPGGKREKGESDEEALVRECKEELSVDLRRETVTPYGVFEAQAFGKPDGTMVRMTCFSAEYDGSLQASAEIEELEWITSQCPHEKLSVTGIMILEDLKAKDMID